MSGAVLFVIIIVVAMAAMVLIGLAAMGVLGNSVRRRDYELMKQQRDLAYTTVDAISEACETYAEIDHPVVSKLKPLISDYYKEERKLRK